jgi:hypothetical protein
VVGEVVGTACGDVMEVGRAYPTGANHQLTMAPATSTVSATQSTTNAT